MSLPSAALLAALTALPAQYTPEAGSQYPDPALCHVVVEDLGNVGYRIADAQQLAERAVSALRKRMGNDKVIYEGLLKNATRMKKMLGKGSETQIQDDQIAYYSAASKAAPWRLRIKFGKRRGQQYVEVSCRKSADPPKKAVQKKTLTGKSFLEVRDAFASEMATFCSEMDPPPAAPPAEQQAAPRPKKQKEWSLPPVRH